METSGHKREHGLSGPLDNLKSLQLEVNRLLGRSRHPVRILNYVERRYLPEEVLRLADDDLDIDLSLILTAYQFSE